MNDKLDSKIRHKLEENDSIVVPQKISNGIDETLKSLNNRKVSNKKKLAMIASLAVILMITPIGVKAAKDVIYTYIPSRGEIETTDSVIYSLDKAVVKNIGKRKVSLKDIYYDRKSKMIFVNVEGNGQLPSEEAKIKINNEKIKSIEGNMHTVSNSELNISWVATYIFEYEKEYNEKNIKFEFTLDNGNKAGFKCKLNQAKQIKDINELGPTATSKDIKITAVVDEEDNKMDITLLNNLKKEFTFVNYGEAPYPTSNTLDGIDEGVINLIDANGNITKGKLVESTDSNLYNRFSFDTTNLVKPFTIDIPYIQTYTSEGVNSSEIIELPIPKNNENLTINQSVEININDETFKDSNISVNIVSIQKDGENCTIELEYPETKDTEVEMLDCVAVPAGDSISPKSTDWFEGGISGNISDEYRKTMTFKLPYSDSDKLFVKLLGSDYKIKGPWRITIE